MPHSSVLNTVRLQLISFLTLPQALAVLRIHTSGYGASARTVAQAPRQPERPSAIALAGFALCSKVNSKSRKRADVVAASSAARANTSVNQALGGLTSIQNLEGELLNVEQ
jgi:hypothetical protein